MAPAAASRPATAKYRPCSPAITAPALFPAIPAQPRPHGRSCTCRKAIHDMDFFSKLDSPAAARLPFSGREKRPGHPLLLVSPAHPGFHPAAHGLLLFLHGECPEGPGHRHPQGPLRHGGRGAGRRAVQDERRVRQHRLLGAGPPAAPGARGARLAAGSLPWLKALDLDSGTKQYSLPHVDPLLEKTFPLYEKRSYISLYRTLYDEYRRVMGILEVKQFTDTIFRSMPSQSTRVLVFDGAGVRLYPFESDRPDPAYEVLRGRPDGQLLTLGGRELAVAATSGQSGWRVVVSQQQRRLLAPVREFATILVLFGLALLAAAVLLASRLARRITLPLRRPL